MSHNSESVQSEPTASDAHHIAEPPHPADIADVADIADSFAFMVTRPRRASIAELWNMPTSQA